MKRLTILNSIYSHAELSTPPFIIDSPRQQDIDSPRQQDIDSPRQQDIDSDNYHNMLNILISNTPDDVQLIIAAVQNNFIDSIKGNFEEINLESTPLTAEEYELANFLILHS